MFSCCIIHTERSYFVFVVFLTLSFIIFYRRWGDKIITVCFILCKNRKGERKRNNETCKNGG